MGLPFTVTTAVASAAPGSMRKVIVAFLAVLGNEPEKINQDPHGAAWLIKIKLANPSEVNSLMDATAYQAYIAEKQKDTPA